MTTPLGVALWTVTRDTRAAAVKMNQVLARKYPLSYYLSAQDHSGDIQRPRAMPSVPIGEPHMTLFQGKFESVEPVKEAVGELAQIPTGSICVPMDDVNVWGDTNFIFWDAVCTPQLLQLHEAVVDKLLPRLARDAVPIGKKQSLRGLTALEEHSLERYGYPFVKKAYRPHITLGRSSVVLQEDEVRRIAENTIAPLKPQSYSYFGERLVVYQPGIDGMCERIIDDFVFPAVKGYGFD